MSTDTAMNTTTENTVQVSTQRTEETVEVSIQQRVVAELRAIVTVAQEALKSPKTILSIPAVRALLSHVHSAASLRLYLERVLLDSGLLELLESFTKINASRLHEIFRHLLSGDPVESLVALINCVVSDSNLYKLIGRALPLIFGEVMPVVFEFLSEAVTNSDSAEQNQNRISEIQAKYEPKLIELKDKFMALGSQIFSGGDSSETNDDDQAWQELHSELVAIVNAGREAHTNSCPTVKRLGERIEEIEAEWRALRRQYVHLATNDHHPTENDWGVVLGSVDRIGELFFDTANELDEAFANEDDDEDEYQRECDEHCACREDDDDDDDDATASSMSANE